MIIKKIKKKFNHYYFQIKEGGYKVLFKKKFKTDQQFILNAHFWAQMPSSFLVKNKHLVYFEI